MKRQLLLFTVIIIFCCTWNVSLTFAAFRDVDVKQYAWAQPSIDFMIDRKVVQGFPDGSFKPDQPVTKAEFTVMVHRLFPLLREPEPESMPGVPPEHWASREFAELYSTIWPIYAADEQNWKNESYTYSPDKKMTRWDMLIVLNALFPELDNLGELSGQPLMNILSKIKDVEKKVFRSFEQYESWNLAYSPLVPIIGAIQENDTEIEINQDLEWVKARALSTFQTRGLMTADHLGNFYPSRPVTRAEFVTILHRLFNIVGEGYTRATPEPDPYPDANRDFIYPKSSHGTGVNNLFYNNDIHFIAVFNESPEGEKVKTIKLWLESQQIVDFYVTINNETKLFTYEQLTDTSNKVTMSVDGIPYIEIQSKIRFPEKLTENGDNKVMFYVGDIDAKS